MPTYHEMLQEINKKKGSAQDEVRRRSLRQLEKVTGRDVILYASAFTAPRVPGTPQQFVSVTAQDMQGMMAAMHGLKGRKLDLVLHSPGGSLEAAEQLVTYLRSKYDDIRAIIPQNAMSAATMLACACDEIVMGKHSAIGPIDPQMTIQTQAGRTATIPAQAILDEFELAKLQIAADPACAPIWIAKIRDYPPGLLVQCQTALALSRVKVEEWLNKWMFRNVAQHGAEIATWLADHQRHRTHGRPIGLDVARELGLRISALEDNQQLQDAVLTVFHAAMVTFQVTNCVKMIESHKGKGWFLQVQQLAVPIAQP
jgi:ATP-dependent protease ClpP protease subunit